MVVLGMASYQVEQVSFLEVGSYQVVDEEDPLQVIDFDLRGDRLPLVVAQVVEVCSDCLV